jgi:hypothetical protein
MHFDQQYSYCVRSNHAEFSQAVPFSQAGTSVRTYLIFQLSKSRFG